MISFILVSVAPQSSQAAVKQGSPCSKISQVQKVGVITFKCMQIGKKKIWQKVSSVNPQSNSSTKSPIQAPTPEVTAKPEPPKVIDYSKLVGQACTLLGETHALLDGNVQCRNAAGKSLKWFKLSATNLVSSQGNREADSIELCKVKDQRTSDMFGLRVGFPLGNNVPRLGKVKVALIPIDFQDTPGTYSALEAITPHVEKVDQWLSQYTNGKLSYDWQISKDWIRNSKGIGDYGVGSTTHFGYFDDRPLVQDLLNSADPYVDFTDVKIVLFVFPRTITDLPIQVIGQNQRLFKTNEGMIGNYWGGGKFAYQRDYEKLLWAIWIHETLHMHGLPLHAPGNGWPLNIGSNQYATSLALDSWQMFLAGWMDEKEIFCKSINNLTINTIELTPIDRKTPGVKSIMIPIGASELLFIESRRAEDFSSELPTWLYGITAVIVDTTKGNDRSQEASGKDNGNDPQYSKYAYYLKSTTGDHELLYLTRGQLDANIFAYEGESFIYKGVKITLEKSGDFDTVKIEKVG